MKAYQNIEAAIGAWANQSSEDGRAASVSFKGGNLTSWGTHIARLVTDLAHRPAVLLSAKKYSDSTSRHHNLAWAEAGKAGIAVFTVWSIDPDGFETNINWHRAKITDTIRKFDRCRAANVAYWRGQVADAIEDAEAYALAFDPALRAWRWDGLAAEHLQHKSVC